MAFVYSVRCNFSDPNLEDAWNEWYSGPKLKQMLAKPQFLSGQRFKATGMNTRRQYLALWTVESPGAFQTPEYTSDWGFFEWAPHITDWSRDLYNPPAAGDPSEMYAAGEGDVLYLVSFEDLSEARAEAELAKVEDERPGVTWLRAAGLDKHSPILGLKRLRKDDPRPQALDVAKIQETIFEPISECARPEVVRAG